MYSIKSYLVVSSLDKKASLACDVLELLTPHLGHPHFELITDRGTAFHSYPQLVHFIVIFSFAPL